MFNLQKYKESQNMLSVCGDKTLPCGESWWCRLLSSQPCI